MRRWERDTHSGTLRETITFQKPLCTVTGSPTARKRVIKRTPCHIREPGHTRVLVRHGGVGGGDSGGFVAHGAVFRTAVLAIKKIRADKWRSLLAFAHGFVSTKA